MCNEAYFYKNNCLNTQFALFKQQITHPVKYRLFLLNKLPMAFIAGLKVIDINPQQASISIKYKWLNQNPFRSLFFAVLSMAAELSTGLLGFAQIYKRQPTVSMLVVKMEASFYKKAIGTIIFNCTDGDKIINAIEQTIATGEGQTLTCTSVGKNEQNEIVAEFIFTWSFKAKSSK